MKLFITSLIVLIFSMSAVVAQAPTDVINFAVKNVQQLKGNSAFAYNHMPWLKQEGLSPQLNSATYNSSQRIDRITYRVDFSTNSNLTISLYVQKNSNGNIVIVDSKYLVFRGGMLTPETDRKFLQYRDGVGSRGNSNSGNRSNLLKLDLPDNKPGTGVRL